MIKYLPLLALFFFSCTKSLELKDFDKANWEAGRDGCSSSRIGQLDYLKEHNELFIGVSEASIQEYLGKPDQRELVARMGRKFHYFITPSTVCSEKGKKRPPALIIEFEQRGIAKMVIVPSKKAILKGLEK